MMNTTQNVGTIARSTKELDALAVDMDGTLTINGRPPKSDLIDMLRELKRGGTRLLLATGRCVKEVYEMVDRDLFDGLVAENGAVLVVEGVKTKLAPASWDEVRASLLHHFEPGCEEVIISVGIDRLGLAREVVPASTARIELNKDRFMIVPPAVDKGKGLRSVMSTLRLTGEGTACVGDGENDLSMFAVTGVKVALENSVDSLKKEADFVAAGSDGEGTMDAIRKLFWRNGTGPGRE